ncbi:MAG: NADP-dependent oxidoreductase, partial [Candidatus Rokuibacteriota bacterium]
MPTPVNRQIVLRSRPDGMPRPGDFDLVESPLPEPQGGEILCRTIYLSLDPYMRGRISGARSYAASVEPGQVIVGGTVGEVLD